MSPEAIDALARCAVQVLTADEALRFGSLCISETERLTAALNACAGKNPTRAVLLDCMRQAESQ